MCVVVRFTLNSVFNANHGGGGIGTVYFTERGFSSDII